MICEAKPKFEHDDCANCKYHGTFKATDVDEIEYDLYVCKGGFGHGSLIARYGKDGDYQSMPIKYLKELNGGAGVLKDGYDKYVELKLGEQ